MAVRNTLYGVIVYVCSNGLGASTITSTPLTFTLSLLPLEVPHLPKSIASALDPSVLGYSCAT